MKQFFTRTASPMSVLLLAILSLPAQAALISQDSTFGVDSITFDTETNLGWLDLPYTLGFSYNDIQAAIGSGGVFAGYRLATLDEALSLFVNAGIPHVNVTGRHLDNEAPARAFMADFIGQTSEQTAHTVVYPEAFGITADLSFGGGGARRAGIDLVGGQTELPGGGFDDTYSVGGGGTRGISSSSSTIGALLVQSTVVPVPAAVWLFGSALIGLIGVARRSPRVLLRSV